MTVAASPVLRKSVDDVDVDEPLDLKAPVIGAVVVALEILMAVFGRGATRFQLSTGADLTPSSTCPPAGSSSSWSSRPGRSRRPCAPGRCAGPPRPCG